MLNLKLQYFGHLMHRNWVLENTLMWGKIQGGKRRGRQRMRSLDGSTDSMDMGMSKLQKFLMDRKPGVLQSMGSQTVGQDWETELTEDTLNQFHVFISQFENQKSKRVSLFFKGFPLPSTTFSLFHLKWQQPFLLSKRTLHAKLILLNYPLSSHSSYLFTGI